MIPLAVAAWLASLTDEETSKGIEAARRIVQAAGNGFPEGRNEGFYDWNDFTQDLITIGGAAALPGTGVSFESHQQLRYLANETLPSGLAAQAARRIAEAGGALADPEIAHKRLQFTPARHLELSAFHRRLGEDITATDAKSVVRKTGHEHAAAAHSRAATDPSESYFAINASRRAGIDPFSYRKY